MPISSQVPIIGYVANGVTKSFAFPFAILSADDLKVKVGADVVTTGFSIAGVGDRDGGSVTFTDAPASLTPIILYREVTLDRTTDYQENGDLLAIVLDDDLDRIWMALQDQLLLSDRALRSPLGETLQQLPPASERALMALAFDAAGNPIVVRGTNDGGAALALDLMDTAPGKGAALVGYDGGTAQDVLDEAKPMANYTALRAYTGRATGVRITQSGLAGFFQRDDADTTSSDNGGTIIVDASGRRWRRQGFTFVTPEMFGAKANDAGVDSTAAINAALATGLDVYGDAASTYYVSDVIVSKGQALAGGFKISSSKKIRPDFTGPIGLVDTCSQDIVDPNDIKFCFVQRSHDLVEFLKLKSLGFNTILHYDLYNAGGTIDKVLDNAKTAGLRVIVGTENRSADVDTQVAFWSAYDSHPALYAYSMFDEPVARNISTATQESKVAKYRAMTQKPLTVTENYVDSLSILPVINSFDIYFLHAYSRNWADADVNVKVSKDLGIARKAAAFYRSVFREKRIVPVVGLFVSSTADGMSNNQTQINTFAGIYGKANNGSLGVFIWDVLATGGAIQDNLGNNASFQKTWLTCSQADSPLRQSAICFGKGSSTAYDFGMGDLVNSALRTFDTSYAQNTNAWPVALSSGGSETLFSTAVAGQVGYSGIAFKTTSATYHSSILIGRYGTVYAWLVEMTSAFVGTINVYLSADNGVTKTLVGTTTSTVVDLTFSNPFASDAVLIIEVTSTSAASTNFRRFMRGVIMSSEW